MSEHLPHMDAPLIALTRAVSPRVAECELTHLARTPVDAARAAAQHAAYEQALRELGCTVVRAAPVPEHPDSVFVEDAAVVVDEVAVATRPGAAARRGEVPGVAEALAAHRPVVHLRAPATLDGGDVLRMGRTLYVGISRRTGEAGAAALRAILRPFGYRVVEVEVRGCLHLKTGVTAISDDTVLLNPAWVPADAFAEFRRVEVDAAEPFAANALQVGEGVVYPRAFPATRRRIEALGIGVRTVDASELAKAEGGVTCCSIVFAGGPAAAPQSR